MNKKTIGISAGFFGILTAISGSFISEYFIIFGLIGGYILGYYSYV